MTEEREAERVLILMPERETAETTRRLLRRAGWCTELLDSEDQLMERLKQSPDAVLASINAFSPEGITRIGAILRAQPLWSTIPLILTVRSGDDVGSLEGLGPLAVLQEPVQVGALLGTLGNALGNRRRQFQVRDLLLRFEAEARTKAEFLRNISHEIRTPLGAVLGFTDLMLDQPCDEHERRLFCGAVKRNGYLLSNLLEDLLDVSSHESGALALEVGEVQLDRLIESWRAKWEPLAQKKGLRLLLERAVKLPAVVRTDAQRLGRVVGNLVGNAIKFTGHGLVTLSFGFEPGPNRLTVAVEDTGVGISEAQAASLFQPFTQADMSATRRYGGTGLGLYLSRQLLEPLGGDLRLAWSIPGGGSRFEIVLPVEVAAKSRIEEPARPVAAAGAEPEGEPLSGAQILVVDDSEDNQILIGRTLSLLGAKVETASDGEEGVERALLQEYDVILMDMQMPKMGGVEATRLLRERGYRRPIVALTAHSQQENRQLCLSVGCTEYLTKPVQKSDLAQVLSRMTAVGGPVSRVPAP